MRILHTPNVGLHKKDERTGLWERYPTDPAPHAIKYDLKLGYARQFYSKLQDGYFGVASYRYDRIGTLYDKWITMMAITARSWGYYNNSINWLYSSYHDLFTTDSTKFLSQALSGVWDSKSPMLFHKCSKVDSNGKCLASVSEDPIEPAWHFFLQYMGMGMALGVVSNPFHDATFSNYMLVGLKGSGKSWTPPGMGEVKCPPIESFTGQFKCTDEKNKKDYEVVCFNNFHNTRTYFAVNTKDKLSISYQMVKRGCELGNQLSILRKSGAQRAYIERKQRDLEMIETVLTIMQYYVSLYQG